MYASLSLQDNKGDLSLAEYQQQRFLFHFLSWFYSAETSLHRAWWHLVPYCWFAKIRRQDRSLRLPYRHPERQYTVFHLTVSKSNDFLFDFVHNNFFQFYGLTFPKKHTAIFSIVIDGSIIANWSNRIKSSEPIMTRLWTDSFAICINTVIFQ